jgi:hypothetical protein
MEGVAAPLIKVSSGVKKYYPKERMALDLSRASFAMS